MSTNKKFVTNINWSKDVNAIRKIELDDFKSLNSNISNIYSASILVGSPIDGTITRNDISLFLVRKRMIKLIDIWNSILNSGLFLTAKYINGGLYPDTKMVGSNIQNPLVEYPFKALNSTSTPIYNLDFKTESIFYKLVRLLVASVKNYNWYVLNGVTSATYYSLTGLSPGYVQMGNLVNTSFNPTSGNFSLLMEELIVIIKSLIDETKLTSELNLTFNDLFYSTESGRNAILTLDTYNSKYNLIGKTDSSYLESNIIPRDKNLLYPQFCSTMTRNTETEPWSTRNVILDTSTYNPDNVPELNIYRQPSLIVCSQLKMDRPIKIDNVQYINWNDSDDEPYVMIYNGGTFIHIPDEIKYDIKQPDNQLNIAAKFWKLGTQDSTDLKYNKLDDIKLKLDHPLTDLTKLDYFDNLTLYMKLD